MRDVADFAGTGTVGSGCTLSAGSALTGSPGSTFVLRSTTVDDGDAEIAGGFVIEDSATIGADVVGSIVAGDGLCEGLAELVWTTGAACGVDVGLLKALSVPPAVKV